MAGPFEKTRKCLETIKASAEHGGVAELAGVDAALEELAQHEAYLGGLAEGGAMFAPVTSEGNSWDHAHLDGRVAAVCALARAIPKMLGERKQQTNYFSRLREVLPDIIEAFPHLHHFADMIGQMFDFGQPATPPSASSQPTPPAEPAEPTA